MKVNLKKYITSIIGYGLVVAIIIVIVSVIAIFGGSIMTMFGFEFTSVKSIILFFIVVSILGFPLEILAKSLPKVMLSLNKISLPKAKILFVIMDTCSTAITMKIVDNKMDGVSATNLSILVISFIFAILSISDLKVNDD